MQISNKLYDSVKLAFIKDSKYRFFIDYCYNLSIGLRKDALKKLNDFIDYTDNWILADKQDFCFQLFSKIDEFYNDYNALLSNDLKNRLIEPTFIKLIDSDINNIQVLKWYGYYFDKLELLKKAYDLNKQDKILNKYLFIKLLNNIWISAHHLPDTYLGIIDDDIDNINLAKQLIPTCIDFKELDLYKQNLMDYEQMILDYIKNNKI